MGPVGASFKDAAAPTDGKLLEVPTPIPPVLAGLAARSAAPHKVELALERLAADAPGDVDAMVDAGEPTPRAAAFVAVSAASDSLGRFCTAEPRALDVLDDLGATPGLAVSDAPALGVSHRLELLRIAARDLLGLDSLEDTTRALSDAASRALDVAVALAGADGGGLAVIGMGKLGGSELNYASDVDIVLVSAPGPDDASARRVVSAARHAFRVDTDLRPEGRSGPLTRTLDGYRGYWDRWAQTWEFQALIKARPVAGDSSLGDRFCEVASSELWGRTYSSDELALVRRLKERSEEMIATRGLSETELKRSRGGIRDVEFAVQLLQLVHGRNDPTIRARSTLGALAELAGSGYVGTEQAGSLSVAYTFLRTVEHRVQLVEEQQTHTVPTDPLAKERLARVLGFEGAPGSTPIAEFDEALRVCRTDVRSLHEKLFFRPLLEAFASLPSDRSAVARPGGTGPAAGMSAEQITERLNAFGFAGPERTKAAVDELARGLTRSSRLMGQMLPLLLDWLSVTPDPDLGLLGLRNLALHTHNRSRLVSTFRESPEAARRLCLVLGSSRTIGETIARNPELIGRLADDDALSLSPRTELEAELSDRMRVATGRESRRARLLRFRQEQLVQIAARDLLGLDGDTRTESTLCTLADVILEAALADVAPGVPLCIFGLGRFGGGELSYASDLDVVFVHGSSDARPSSASNGGGARADAEAEAAAEKLVRLLHGATPAVRIFNLDLGLRPEGGHGRLSRDVPGYAAYFDRWAQTWERQALLRTRFVTGDRDLAERFSDLVDSFVWGTPVGPDEVAEIRRMKARIERERIPAGEDPQFHLKLGRGSLSDVEWTVQLLQLVHAVRGAATLDVLDELEARGIVAAPDASALREAYRFCETTRNRWHLGGSLPGGASPGDSLPTHAHELSGLARSLATTPAALRDDYRRVTRRSRRVMERLFYGIEEPESQS